MSKDLIKIDGLTGVIKNNLPLITETAERAKAALSKYDASFKIADEKTDAQTAADLKKTVATIKKVEDLRKEVTTLTDGLKKQLMQPEKELKEYEQLLRNARNEYATAKAQEQERKAQEIEKQKQYKLAVISFKSYVENRALNAPLELKEKALSGLNALLISTTEENHKDKLKSLNVKPKLKEELYNKIFDVSSPELEKDDIKTIILGVQEEHPLKDIQEKYIEVLTPLIEEYKQKIIDKVQALKVNKKEAQKAAEQEAAEQERKLKEEQQKKAAEQEAKKQEQEINAQLEAQVISQQVEEKAKNTREYYEGEVKNANAYPHLIAFFIQSNIEAGKIGDIEKKLKFLVDYAAKNGCPEINGVKYTKKVTTILK